MVKAVHSVVADRLICIPNHTLRVLQMEDSTGSVAKSGCLTSTMTSRWHGYGDARAIW
jgi:hypothetical protein